ncbi:Inositol 2-dehydrogenase [Planctomycetes bacterium Pan216]|uniref:Inositol 2-dehydrogenase n=1 Tax=Kolteria novifilia TaxID=2527975 RepID=A0A518BCL7_9BACT|nr:Inositol 2-dehydrogenase [Planctomycetes bacterium Pan216]
MAETTYGLANVESGEAVPAPKLDYQPPRPNRYSPKIGLIGCGGISGYHLAAYREMGLEVVAICSRDRTKAERRRDEFFPDADVTDDYRELLRRDDIEVVDLAIPPAPRVGVMEAALKADKHVLSQKPFVTDLEEGKRLVDLAERRGRKLAVNQNGRWAPHFAYLGRAIDAGTVGRVSSIDFVLHWDHTWTAGTAFEEIHHLVLYDFGIHWFDIATRFLGGRSPHRVFASVARSSSQAMKPPLLAHVVAEADGAQVRMSFNAQVRFGQEDRTVVAGELGTLRAFGPELNEQSVGLWTTEGVAAPALDGDWFTSGFQGTMGELLCAIEENREPTNGARGNLESLAFCFAALRSADTGRPEVPGSVMRVA